MGIHSHDDPRAGSVFALLMFGGIWGWRRFWARRDHQALFCTALVVMCGIWVQLWYDKTICPRYALPIVLMASPFAALGLLGSCGAADSRGAMANVLSSRRTVSLAERRRRRAANIGTVAWGVFAIVAAIGLTDAMTSNARYFEARQTAMVFGRWLVREFPQPFRLVGPPGITAIAGYYAHNGPYPGARPGCQRRGHSRGRVAIQRRRCAAAALETTDRPAMRVVDPADETSRAAAGPSRPPDQRLLLIFTCWYGPAGSISCKSRRLEARNSNVGPKVDGMAQQLTVLIPCKNETHYIRACIESARQVADEILVADSLFTDDTLDIVRRAGGCRIIHREFVDHADFKNWAIPQACHPWVLVLDADERVTEELAAEIRADARPRRPVAGRLSHEARQLFSRLSNPALRLEQSTVIRLFRRDACRYGPPGSTSIWRSIPKRVGTLRGKLIHYTCTSLDQWMEKQNRYSTVIAEDKHAAGHWTCGLGIFGIPLVRFIHLYFFRGGFLDGTPGLIVSLSSAFYTFLKHAKLWHLNRLASTTESAPCDPPRSDRRPGLDAAPLARRRGAGAAVGRRLAAAWIAMRDLRPARRRFRRADDGRRFRDDCFRRRRTIARGAVANPPGSASSSSRRAALQRFPRHDGRRTGRIGIARSSENRRPAGRFSAALATPLSLVLRPRGVRVAGSPAGVPRGRTARRHAPRGT